MAFAVGRVPEFWRRLALCEGGIEISKQISAPELQALLEKITHDLRQPLNVIGLAAANIRYRSARALSDAQGVYLSDKLLKIEAQVELARRLLDEFEARTRDFEP